VLLSVVVLAAGVGSRMRSDIPKVMQPIMGEPMLGHVLKQIAVLNPAQVLVVVGDRAAIIEEYLLQQQYCKAQVVHQAKQLGTGHAVLTALDNIDSNNQVLVLLGDVPGVDSQELVEFANLTVGKLGIMTAEVDNPDGLGRIVRSENGDLVSIVEQINATSQQLMLREVNTGIVTAPAKFLQKYLPLVKADRLKKEYYLLSVLPFWQELCNKVVTFKSENHQYLRGVNTFNDLYYMRQIMQERVLVKLLNEGVNICDIKQVQLRGNVSIAKGCILDPNIILQGEVSIGANCTIGTGAVLKNCVLGENVVIKPYSVCENVTIANNVQIGPFASLSGNTYIGEKSYVGSFVEVKRSTVGENVKAKHLAYLGDAEIEANVNIGAGVITCNYDGANKHKSKIQKDSFVGAGVNLIAPIVIEKSAFVAAGTTLRENAPAGKLVVAAVKPKFLTWKKPNKITSVVEK
jgi:bifunctional UDP-N-acetylglucosamine pyrophosphorylase/glucosamine-1-phosphate N-acetyltransferase